MAQQWGCPFFETSAALRHFVDDTFHGIVREIRHQERALMHPNDKQKRKKAPKQIQGLLTKLKVFRKDLSGNT